MTSTTFRPGTLVTDRSDSSRYYRSVYRVTGAAFSDRTIVARVGHILPGGRLDCSGDHGVTHRTTANLVEWK